MGTQKLTLVQAAKTAKGAIVKLAMPNSSGGKQPNKQSVNNKNYKGLALTLFDIGKNMVTAKAIAIGKSIKKDALSFAGGAIYETSNSGLFGIPDSTLKINDKFSNNKAFQVGRMAGATGTMIVGGLEILSGGSAIAGGTVVSVGSGGTLAVAGVPAAVGGVALTGVGVAHGISGAAGFMDASSRFFAKGESNAGNRPPSLTPEGAGRNGAFREAKRNSGIPVSGQSKVTPAVDKRGNRIPGRDYDFGDGKVIREHTKGHEFPDDPTQNRGPHFNDPDGNHYDY